MPAHASEVVQGGLVEAEDVSQAGAAHVLVGERGQREVLRLHAVVPQRVRRDQRLQVDQQRHGVVHRVRHKRVVEQQHSHTERPRAEREGEARHDALHAGSQPCGAHLHALLPETQHWLQGVEVCAACTFTNLTPVPPEASHLRGAEEHLGVVEGEHDVGDPAELDHVEGALGHAPAVDLHRRAQAHLQRVPAPVVLRKSPEHVRAHVRFARHVRELVHAEPQRGALQERVDLDVHEVARLLQCADALPLTTKRLTAAQSRAARAARTRCRPP